LFVQNPSLVLAMVAVFLRPLYGYRLIVDAHNEAVRPFIHTAWPFPALARWLLRRADVTIVTNEALAAVVRAAGGSPHVLPDCLPEPPSIAERAKTPAGAFSVMVVATYAADEPIPEILEAARSLGPEFQFHVTGNDRKLPATERQKLPANVTLAGFLPESDYWALMGSCDVVLDLTLMPDCLVCGAYEALSLHKPMILSDSPAARQLFEPAALMASPDPAGIEASVRGARARNGELLAAAPQVAARFAADWKRSASALLARIND
jgi:glycosyltransferase involved in cell wall biosynthesis